MTFIHFDQMAWPLPQAEQDGLAWKLRYAPGQVTEADMMSAAEILCAYHAMIIATQNVRNAVCRKLRKAIKND